VGDLIIEPPAAPRLRCLRRVISQNVARRVSRAPIPAHASHGGMTICGFGPVCTLLRAAPHARAFGLMKSAAHQDPLYLHPFGVRSKRDSFCFFSQEAFCGSFYVVLSHLGIDENYLSPSLKNTSSAWGMVLFQEFSCSYALSMR
jgi:hypothetical protein